MFKKKKKRIEANSPDSIYTNKQTSSMAQIWARSHSLSTIC